LEGKGRRGKKGREWKGGGERKGERTGRKGGRGREGKGKAPHPPTKILDPPLSLSIIGCSKSAHINEVC